MLCAAFRIADIFTFDTAKLNNLDMAFFIYDKEISLSNELIEPLDTRHLARISQTKSIVLFIHFVALIKDKRFLSVMVIDKGKIIGVSDCLSRSDFCSSNIQRLYLTSQGKIGIVIDKDIFIAESVRSHYINDADYIVFMADQCYNADFARILYAHRVLSQVPIIGVFNDCIYCYSRAIQKKDINEIVYMKYYKRTCNLDLIGRFNNPSIES